ncbi:hypothetical protein D3C71_2064430 [compost metagenome]
MLCTMQDKGVVFDAGSGATDCGAQIQGCVQPGPAAGHGGQAGAFGAKRLGPQHLKPDSGGADGEGAAAGGWFR